MRVLGKQVLVKPEKREKVTESGIAIAEWEGQSKILRNTFPFIGEVIGLGIEVAEGYGVEVGDRVIYARWGTIPIELEGEEYLIVPISDVLVVID